MLLAGNRIVHESHGAPKANYEISIIITSAGYSIVFEVCRSCRALIAGDPQQHPANVFVRAVEAKQALLATPAVFLPR